MHLDPDHEPLLPPLPGQELPEWRPILPSPDLPLEPVPTRTFPTVPDIVTQPDRLTFPDPPWETDPITPRDSTEPRTEPTDPNESTTTNKPPEQEETQAPEPEEQTDDNGGDQGNNRQGREGYTRNPAQDKLLSPGEIKKLKDAGYDIHDLKPGAGTDLYKDRDGNVYVKPKGGAGSGEPTGININEL